MVHVIVYQLRLSGSIDLTLQASSAPLKSKSFDHVPTLHTQGNYIPYKTHPHQTIPTNISITHHIAQISYLAHNMSKYLPP